MTTPIVPEVQETGSTEEVVIEQGDLTVEQYKSIVEKLRHEAADKRVKNKALDAELSEFKTWKESQMTELQRAQAQVAELTATNTKLSVEKTQASIASEFGLDKELAEFLGTGDEDEMRARAEKLAKRATSTNTNVASEANAVTDLFGGKRGTPVVPNQTNWLSELFED